MTGAQTFLGWNSDWKAFNYKRYKASPSFQLIKADFNGSFSLANESQLGWRFSGQLTDSLLISGEQIAAGGANSVRGYLSAETTGDVGAVTSLEWRTKPLTYLGDNVDSWRAYVFADASHLRLRSPLPEQQSRFSLASVGLGSSLRVARQLSARVDLGYPLLKGPRTQRHEPRLTFNLNANY